MRTKDLEDVAVPVIMEALQSGEATSEQVATFQTQLLVGILMALNDLLEMVEPKQSKPFLNVYTLPIVD